LDHRDRHRPGPYNRYPGVRGFPADLEPPAPTLSDLLRGRQRGVPPGVPGAVAPGRTRADLLPARSARPRVTTKTEKGLTRVSAEYLNRARRAPPDPRLLRDSATNGDRLLRRPKATTARPSFWNWFRYRGTPTATPPQRDRRPGRFYCELWVEGGAACCRRRPPVARARSGLRPTPPEGSTALTDKYQTASRIARPAEAGQSSSTSATTTPPGCADHRLSRRRHQLVHRGARPRAGGSELARRIAVYGPIRSTRLQPPRPRPQKQESGPDVRGEPMGRPPSRREAPPARRPSPGRWTRRFRSVIDEDALDAGPWRLGRRGLGGGAPRDRDPSLEGLIN